MPVKASIDLGTNSTRLLIVKDEPNARLLPVYMEDRVTRLGQGFDNDWNLSIQAMDRVIDAILAYKNRLREYQIKYPIVFATSATRDAVNANTFLDRIKNKTGYNVRVLSGAEEARFSYLGAVSDFPVQNKSLVIDIGGGSTECIYSKGKEIVAANSLNIGSRRLTGRFLHGNPPTPAEIDNMVQFIRKTLRNELPLFSPHDSLSVGGTACTLALMVQRMDHRNYTRAHHYLLKKTDLQNILNDLAVKSIDERKKIPGLEPERSDVILTGATLLYELMQFFNLNDTRVSLRDLMFGILMEQP